MRFNEKLIKAHTHETKKWNFALPLKCRQEFNKCYKTSALFNF